jgi:hypothetical protein
VVQHGSTSSGTGPVRHVDGEVVLRAGWTRESGVVGAGGGVVLHPVLALVVILDADEGD